jgi:hypothetical protein
MIPREDTFMKKTASIAFILCAAVMITMPAAAAAQANAPTPQKDADIWAPFRYFAGSWQGKGEGKNGVSRGKLTFQFILRDKFLQAKNETRFDPQGKNPKGKVHEDFGIFSYDQARACYVYRQFHVEGFVNQYICKKILDEGKTLIFVSERLENLPPEMKARLTYKILNPSEFQMTFDLAMPGSDYECYSTGVLKRVR